jgi:hypothetical protein
MTPRRVLFEYRYWGYSLLALAAAVIIVYSLRVLRRHRS